GVASKSILTQTSRFESTMTDGGRNYNLTLEGHVLVDGESFIPLQIITDEVSGDHRIVYQTRDEKIVDMTDKLSGGKIGAQLELRGRTYDKKTQRYDGGILQGYKDDLNTFAKTLITHANNIYASSAKSSVQSDTLSYLTDDTTLTNYDKNIQTGTFDVIIYDDKGQEVNKKTIT
ncbi:FlgK family flagellar hook-associated protein, partial [Campylobacter taeniopygiae]